MKVSGWTRIGIIASAVWMIGAGFCTLKVPLTLTCALQRSYTVSARISATGQTKTNASIAERKVQRHL